MVLLYIFGNCQSRNLGSRGHGWCFFYQLAEFAKFSRIQQFDRFERSFRILGRSGSAPAESFDIEPVDADELGNRLLESCFAQPQKSLDLLGRVLGFLIL